MSSRTSRRSRASGAHTPRVSVHGRYGTRLCLGGYVADIVPDKDRPSIHHCIVQRLGSPNVLYLGQEATFAAALESGHRHLEELAKLRLESARAIYELATAETSK